MGKKLKELVKSRKFWVAVSGVVGLAFHDVLGIPLATTESISNVVMAWLLSHGAVDAVKALK